jgi:phosphoribosyl 1,2-cyclic phosphodiesterase
MLEIQCLASGSGGNCYRIDNGSAPLLLECGIPFKEIQKRLDFKTAELAGCLVSHGHADHCKAAKDVLRAGIDVYLSQPTAEHLKVFGAGTNIIEPGRQFNIGSYTILPFELQHDFPNIGFLVAEQGGDKLVYITDTFYSRYVFPGLTHIMIETNYALDILRANVEAGTVPEALKNRILKSHFSLENVKKFLQANDLSKVQEIHLIHLSDQNSDEACFKWEVQVLTGIPTYIAGGY